MSDSRSTASAASMCNLLQSQGGSPLARAVQAGRSTLAMAGAVLLMMLCATLAGCVIPPSLRAEEDAGPRQDSPPAILSVSGDRTVFAEPGPVVLEQGNTASTLDIQLLDTDVNDDLYVRLFVDYNAPDRLPPRIQCNVPHTGAPRRRVNCNVSGLCMSSDIGVQRNLTVVVSDRMPMDFGADPQQIDSSGVSTDRFYFLRCQPPQMP
jgi:hypothetical protein